MRASDRSNGYACNVLSALPAAVGGNKLIGVLKAGEFPRALNGAFEPWNGVSSVWLRTVPFIWKMGVVGTSFVEGEEPGLGEDWRRFLYYELM
jgi:hypothetical protein